MYVLQATTIGLSGLARRIHEMSGWSLPSTVNASDIGRYERGEDGEELEVTICDRSQPEAINQLSRWGLSCAANTKPELNPKKVSEIRDGIF